MRLIGWIFSWLGYAGLVGALVFVAIAVMAGTADPGRHLVMSLSLGIVSCFLILAGGRFRSFRRPLLPIPLSN